MPARQARPKWRKSAGFRLKLRDFWLWWRSTMTGDDEFTPRLGRQRQQGTKPARLYLGRVVGAAVRSAEKGAIKSRRFDGSRIGRGASMGRLISSRDRFGGLRARRAVVKTRLIRIGSKSMPAARAHLRYIQRDGARARARRAKSIRLADEHRDRHYLLVEWPCPLCRYRARRCSGADRRRRNRAGVGADSAGSRCRSRDRGSGRGERRPVFGRPAFAP